MIEIDGSTYEGSGQILRTALSLSAIYKKPCHIFNIRKKRKKPGLATQHLVGARSLADLCQAKLKGDSLESQEIWFYPKEIKAKNISIKIKTAASIALVLQSLILPALKSKEPIEISFDGGATDTFFSPTIDHFQFVFLEILKKMGVKIEIEIIKRGFYPQGEAKVKIKIFPLLYQDQKNQFIGIKPVSLVKRGKLEKILIISGASENLFKNKVAERQISGAKQVLGKLNLPIEEKIEYYSAESTGSQINIISKLENTILGSDNLGKLGKSAEIVGQEAAISFLKEVKSGTCIDKYTADQILPFMAICNKPSKVSVSEITLHCKTNIWVIEKFLNGKFEIKENIISWNPK